MSKLINSSFLIPLIPLSFSLLIAILLFSFNRTMNRLTKPVSFLLINSILVSTLYSGFLFYRHVSGKFDIQPFSFFNSDFLISFRLDESSEIFLIISGIIALSIMLLSYFKLPRNKGYVMYLTSVCSFFGLLFLYVLSTYSTDLFLLAFKSDLS